LTACGAPQTRDLDRPKRCRLSDKIIRLNSPPNALATASPAETALTPVGRMAGLRARLAAVRAATATIRPALTRFYDALDQGQKVGSRG
jgi:hypothetical protein